MADLTNLANSLLKLDNDLVTCMRCGNCQAICPVFNQTGKESDVARGKIVLLQNLAYQLLQNPKAVDERLSRCLLCGSCQFNCSSGVKTLEIFLEARRILTSYQKLPWTKKIIFRSLLPHPKLFSTLIKISAKFQGLFLRKQNNLQQTATAPLLSPILGRRHLPNLPENQFSQKYKDLDTSSKNKKFNVILYPGCMLDKIYPQIGEAILKIFKHYEIGVKIPRDFVCCGMPVLASGDNQGFLHLLQKNLATLKPLSSDNSEISIDYVLTACPSCTETMHNWWPYYGQSLDKNSQDLLQEFSPKMLDIHKFLLDIVKIPLNTKEFNVEKTIPLTYHESCHMKKSLKLSAEVKELIKQNKKYNFVEMNESDTCCGCGGSFTLFYPKLSEEIGLKKRDNILSSKAKYVSSACPACMLQLNDILARNKDQVIVKHSIEIFAENLPD